jgi:hypothetical protein
MAGSNRARTLNQQESQVQTSCSVNAKHTIRRIMDPTVTISTTRPSERLQGYIRVETTNPRNTKMIQFYFL